MLTCEKYGEWIKEAALGEVSPRRERELLAHAGECDACREAYQSAREVAALVDRGVEALVAGQPSPEFAARLRARIAEEGPAPRFAWFTWKPVATGFVAAVALAVLWVFLAPSRPTLPPKSGQPVSTIASALPPEAHAPGVASADAAQRNRGHSIALQRHSRTQLVAQQRRGIGRIHSPSEPEVLVPPGQLEAVMQLAADIRSGRIDGKTFVAEQTETQKNMQKPIDIPRIEIKAIEITPVASPPDAAEPPAEPSLH